MTYWIALTLFCSALLFVGFLIGRYVFNPVAKKIEASKRWADDHHLKVLVKQEIHKHAEYEKSRTEVRGRPGWHPDLRNVAIAQRVLREVHRLGLEAEYKEVLHRVQLEIQ